VCILLVNIALLYHNTQHKKTKFFNCVRWRVNWKP